MTRDQMIEVIYEKIAIWHPVMIWDVMDWTFEEKDYQYSLAYDDYWNARHEVDEKIWELMRLREYKRKPIEDQSDECVTFIYNLCKDD